MKELILIVIAAAAGLATFLLIARKFGKDCIP